MSACECPFLSHHLGPCRKEAAHVVGKATRVTLCRERLAHLVGSAEAARRVASAVPLLKEEAQKQQVAGVKCQENQEINTSLPPRRRPTGTGT